jgi:hypothetical protein
VFNFACKEIEVYTSKVISHGYTATRGIATRRRVSKTQYVCPKENCGRKKKIEKWLSE